MAIRNKPHQTSQAPDSEAFDDYLADELAWLKEMEKKEEDGYFYRAKTRLSHQALMKHYQNNTDKLIAMMNVTGNYNYSNYIDTMRVSLLEKYFAYTNTPAYDRPYRYEIPAPVPVGQGHQMADIRTSILL